VSDQDERWLPIADCDGYDISDHGRVRSWVVPGQRYMRRAVPALRALRTDHLGRMCIVLWCGGAAKLVGFRVHRLVLEAFVGPCPEGMEACHNDGDTHNNRLANLRWDTAKANHADKLRHGTAQRGERGTAAKLTWEDVQRIRAARVHVGALARSRLLGAQHGVSPRTIQKIWYGRTWRTPDEVA
jgi:hypothetical protein